MTHVTLTQQMGLTDMAYTHLVHNKVWPSLCKSIESKASYYQRDSLLPSEDLSHPTDPFRAQAAMESQIKDVMFSAAVAGHNVWLEDVLPIEVYADDTIVAWAMVRVQQRGSASDRPFYDRIEFKIVAIPEDEVSLVIGGAAQ